MNKMANREPKVLDNKVLRKVLLRYVMSRQTCFNYETMQSGPWVWSMLPAMQELYSDDEIAEKIKIISNSLTAILGLDN